MSKLLHYLLICLVILSPSLAIAQSQTVSGRITSADDKLPLPGVTILVKGTQIGTASDNDGKFSLNVPSGNAVLVFSFIGYRTEEVGLNGRTELDLVLAPDQTQLSEVVVVGYGTQKKSDLTGSVASVGAKEITEYQTMNVDQALQGRLAGVQVSSKGGKPGANSSIRIRGINSPNGNEPLYVIDGVPVGNGGGANHNTTEAYNLNTKTDMFSRFDISTLNPNDIASIDVLKDASATAIYGSLAANGVVVITTKRGQKGNTKVGFDAYYGTQQLTKEIDMLNATQYLELMQESLENAGQARSALYDELLSNGKYNTNWQKEVYRKAPMQNYNLSLSGGTDNLSYFLSGGILKQDGILGDDASDFEKYSVRLNVDNKVNKWLKLGLNLNGSRTESQLTEQFNNFSPPFDALANLPFLPVRWNPGDEATFGPNIIIGGYSGPTGSAVFGNNSLRRNPILEANEPDRLVTKNMIIGNVKADVSLLKNLTYTASIGGTYNEGYYHSWSPRIQYGTEFNVGVNKLQTGRTSGYQSQIDNYFTYTWAQDDHSITATLGTSATRNRWATLTAERTDFLFDTRSLSGGATSNQAGDSNNFENSIMSYFGRVNYGFKDRYLLTATLRRDGSSKFSDANKFGNFPSFALGWKITNEDFMADVQSIDNLKLRASWGQTGAQNINDFAYVSTMRFESLTQFGMNNDGWLAAANHSNMANNNVKWETTTQLNIGADIGLLDNRLNVSLDWYKKTTDDLLLGSLPLPGYVGIAGPTVNLGTFENKGVEMQADMKDILKGSGGLVWDFGFNVSRNRNTVKSIGTFDESFGRAGYIANGKSRTYVGSPFAMFYGYRTEGIFQSQEEIDALDAQAVARATELGLANPGNAKYQPNNPKAGDIRFKDINGRDASGKVIYGVPDGRVDDADREFIGNPHPKLILGLNTRLAFKNFDFSIFVSGSYGNDIFNQSRQSFERMGGGEFFNQTAAAGLNRWRSADEPGDGKTPRAVWGDPNGNTRDSDRFVEDGSYTRIKNITLGYTFPSSVLSKASISSLRLYVSLNDYFTFTNYSWYNPDLGDLGNNTFAPGVDWSTYPNAKTILFGINMSL